MTTDQKLKLLAEWQASHDQIEEKFNELGKMFNDVTGPLFDAAWQTFTNYTKLVSTLLGDEHEFVEWYWAENDFGKSGLEVGPEGDMREICNFEDLLWVIEVCK